MRITAILLAALLWPLLAQVHGADLVGVEFSTGKVYRVSTSNAALTQIGNTGVIGLAALELAPNGYLYAFDVPTQTPQQLYRIDPSTFAATVVGPLGIRTFEGGIAFSPDGTCYAANSGTPNPAGLFRIDITTGAATFVAPFDQPGTPFDINGLAWRDDGMLVGHDDVRDALVTINPTTGATSILAAVTHGVGSVGGMTVLDGNAYFNTSGTSGELYRFDLTSGSMTLVGNFSPAVTTPGISGLAITPEPAPLALCGLACLLVFANARRRRLMSCKFGA